MEKLYNDKGQVAVAVSHDSGAGWSTWNDNVNPMDKKYNELILNGKLDELTELCEKENVYGVCLSDISIIWMEPGTAFIITEYNGDESIEYRDNTNWNIA